MVFCQAVRAHFLSGVVLAAALFQLSLPARAQDRFQTLHDFKGETNPGSAATLLQGEDGSLYGTSSDGGDFDGGLLFRLTLDGSFSVVHSFPYDMFSSPAVRLQMRDGSLLVVTGSNEGTIHRVAADASTTVLATGVHATFLVEARDGQLYGIGFFAHQQRDSFFRIEVDGTVTVLHEFQPTGVEGYCPTSLLQAADGNFYGINACNPDASIGGTVFRLAADGTIAILHAFGRPTADAPQSLIEGPDGALYGTGQVFDNITAALNGVVFRVTLDGGFSVIHTFAASMSPRLLDVDGSIFHGVVNGWSGQPGSWFSMASDGAVSTISVADRFDDPLVQGHDGSLYGRICCPQGVDHFNRIVKLSTAGTFTVLHTFDHDSSGAHPQSPLVEDPNGNFYGTTTYGGRFNVGTVFRMLPTGLVTVLHEFEGASRGQFPNSLAVGSDGNVYGSADGGAYNHGLIFQITPAGGFAVVYSFTGGADGSQPLGLMSATDGFIYGLAGTIFKLTPSASSTPMVVHSIDFSGRLGAPVKLIQTGNGTFYGTTGSFYPFLTGSVFRLLADGTFTTLHVFDPASEGGYPETLVEGQDGNLYGGTACNGTIFKLTPDGAFTALRPLEGSNCFTLSAFPRSSIALVASPDGLLYGARYRFLGSDDLFSMTTDGAALTVLHSFPEDGTHQSTLMRARSGNLYGTTYDGGASNSGMIFRYNLKPESLIFIDQPISAQVLVEPFTLSGWALDATSLTDAGVDAVHVWAYPNPGSRQGPVFVGVASIGRPRPDVGAYFGTQFDAAGFELTVRGLAPGPYQFVVFTHHTMTASFDDARVVNVTIAPNAPMAIDQPLEGATVFGSVRLSGWAVDRAAASGTGVSTVHVWAYPNPGSGQPPFFVGAASYGGARPDVGAIFGAQFTNSAYDLTVNGLAPGDYQFVVFAYSTVSQSFSTAMTVTVHAPASQAMAVDVPIDGATVSGSFTISGWAIDRAAASGAGVDAVHVWAYRNPGSGQAPFFVGAATYGGARPDVGAIFGPQFTNSAFTLAAPALAPGSYQLVVFARSRVSGTFDNARVVRVVIPPP